MDHLVEYRQIHFGNAYNLFASKYFIVINEGGALFNEIIASGHEHQCFTC